MPTFLCIDQGLNIRHLAQRLKTLSLLPTHLPTTDDQAVPRFGEARQSPEKSTCVSDQSCKLIVKGVNTTSVDGLLSRGERSVRGDMPFELHFGTRVLRVWAWFSVDISSSSRAFDRLQCTKYVRYVFEATVGLVDTLGLRMVSIGQATRRWRLSTGFYVRTVGCRKSKNVGVFVQPTVRVLAPRSARC